MKRKEGIRAKLSSTTGSLQIMSKIEKTQEVVYLSIDRIYKYENTKSNNQKN